MRNIINKYTIKLAAILILLSSSLNVNAAALVQKVNNATTQINTVAKADETELWIIIGLSALILGLAGLIVYAILAITKGIMDFINKW